MSSEDLKNKILEKLSNTIQGGNLYNNMYDEDEDISTAVRIGGGHCGGASAGSLFGGNKDIEKKLKQQTAPNLRKLILSKNIRGVTKMSKKELVDVIMENLDRFPEVHKLKAKPKKQLSESEKQVLRDRLAKARSMKKKGKSKTAKKIKVQEVDSEEEDDIIKILQDEDKFKQFEEDKNLYEHLFSKQPKPKAKPKPKKKPKGIKITKSKTKRSDLLRKMKKEDLKKILKMGGIKGYSKLSKDDLVRVILENPQIYGGSFWSALKDVGSAVLDVGKVVAPFIPLIL